jgi:hypothetical protein
MVFGPTGHRLKKAADLNPNGASTPSPFAPQRSAPSHAFAAF